MARTEQEALFEEFQAIAPRADAASAPEDGAGQSSAGTPGEMASEGAATSSGTAGSGERTTSAKASTAGSIATTVLESGLGLVPLAGELLGLFGGSDAAPAPLEKYAMPDSNHFVGVDTGSGVSAGDFDQMGMPRLDESDPADIGGGGATAGSGASTNVGASTAGGTTGPQITVNVQAMDAQSFLDRSSDIAQAVRSAMLNMSSINDVVNEL
jgi:hypothetical protein